MPVFPEMLSTQPIAGLTFNNQIFIDDNTGSQGYVLQNGAWVPTFGFIGYPITGSALVKTPFPDNNSISLLALGGIDESGMGTNQWFILTPTGWQDVQPTLPQYFSSHCALLYNLTTVLVIAGQNADFLTMPDVFIFNSVTMAWTKAANLNFGRINHYCAMIKSSDQSQEIVPMAIGGMIDGIKLTSTEYSLDLSSWAMGPELPNNITGATIVSNGIGGIVLVGGQDGDVVLDTLLYLGHAQSQWHVLSIKLKTQKTSATAISLPDGVVNCG